MSVSAIRQNNPRYVYELYYRRDGQRRSIICNNRREVNLKRENLRRNRRKFLGVRSVTLIERV